MKGDEITITPFLSPSLPCYSAQTETLYGTVRMAVERKNGGMSEIKVLMPFGCRGKIRLGDVEKPLKPGFSRWTHSWRRASMGSREEALRAG